MSNKVKNILSVFICLLGLFFIFTSNAHSSPAKVKADYLFYDSENKYALLKTSASIEWQGKNISANQIELFFASNTAKAVGDVVLYDSGSVVFADLAEYNTLTSTGSLQGAFGYFDPFYFLAQNFTRKGADKFSLTDCEFTTCNKDDPDFTISATSVDGTLKKNILIYNAVYRVKNIPIFYFPLVPFGLGKHRHTIYVEPGYNNSDGFFLRAIYGYPISDYIYSNLYLDYYSRRGTGKGGQLTYNVPNKMNGSLYLYHIYEQTTDIERLSARATHWQKLSPLWTGQSQLNYYSDRSFNSQYFLDNWQSINSNIDSNLSLTRQDSAGNFRVLVARSDSFDQTKMNYAPTIITAPSLSYSLYPVKGKMPFYTVLNGAIQNQYTKADDFYLISGSFDAAIYKDFKINRKLTLTPRIGITQNWQDATSKTDDEDIFVTHYYTSENLRYRLASWVDWNLIHSFKLRSIQNSTAIDENANDFGIESNLISYTNTMYPARRLTLRNSTSFDARTFRLSPFYTWTDRFTPVVSEITWFPSNFYNLYLREETTIAPIDVKLLQGLFNIGDPSVKYANFGLFYQNAYPDQLGFNFGFGTWIGPKWKLDYSARAYSYNYLSNVALSDQSVQLYRDLHCWDMRLTYKKHTTSEEFFVYLDLKVSGKVRQTQFNKEAYLDTHPWQR
ncbi:MAG: hypothetical protein M0Q46_03510 [Endomicrobiales bacterium]|nr:hypothetical protein [Endomicrobiales bacterium]